MHGALPVTLFIRSLRNKVTYVYFALCLVRAFYGIKPIESTNAKCKNAEQECH